MRASPLPPTARAVLLPALVAAAVFLVALDGGGYALRSRHAVAVGVLWLIAVALALGFWPRARIPAVAFGVGGLLAAFAAFTGLSVLWAPSAENSFNEFDRVVLYVAVFAVAVLAIGARSTLRAWRRGLGIGITAVGLLALASRLFPEQFADTSAVELAQLYGSAASRLNYPLEYWNALAALLALAIPILFWAATTERLAVARGLALAPVPALSAALYLTSSRGGIAAAAVGAAVFVALARRWRALGAIVLGTLGSVAAVAAVIVRDALTSAPLSPEAVSEGKSAALQIALACVVTGVAHGAASSARLRLGRLALPLGYAAGAAAIVVVGAGLVAFDPLERFERFKAVPTTDENATLESHLASGSGNGRWQLWESAVDQFRANELAGGGAGTYEAWWAENGTLGLFVRDAHSLFLETLAELGVIGFALLAGAIMLGLGTGVVRSLQASTDFRVAPAALTGVFCAWLVEAGIDWIWEFTVVTLVAVACLGLLVGAATRDVRPRPPRHGAAWIAARVVIPIVALGLVVAQAIPLFAQSEVERSKAAVRAGNELEALEAATSAQRVQPWASTPHVQRALVEELLGDLPAADDAIDRALANNPREWRFWLVDARLETKRSDFAQAERSLRRAVELNPRSQRFRGFPGAEDS